MIILNYKLISIIKMPGKNNLFILKNQKDKQIYSMKKDKNFYQCKFQTYFMINGIFKINKFKNKKLIIALCKKLMKIN